MCQLLWPSLAVLFLLATVSVPASALPLAAFFLLAAEPVAFHAVAE